MNDLKLRLRPLSLLLSAMVLFAAPNLYAKGIGPSVAIEFEPNHSALTPESKLKLDEVVKQARATGKIDEVRIAAWSDNPAPRKDEQLSKVDRSLAQKRSKTIKDYLKDSMKVSSVDSYNMAERANWLARTFDTDEAKLKSEIGGKKDVMSKTEFQVFKEKGEPSKAVVLVMMKD